MKVDASWKGDNFKRHVRGNAKDSIIRLAHEVEKFAKLNITVSIYNRPQIGNYVRTGAAMSSIHTQYLPREIACLIGSDSKSLNNARVAAGATSSTVFYFGYLEDGFHTKKGVYKSGAKKGQSYGGRFIAGHHMLKNALDRVKIGLR